MSQKNALRELEIRGKFDSLDQLIQKRLWLDNHIGTVSHRFRLSVIFTSLYDKNIDIQVRLHDLNGELVLKQGKLTGAERQETRLHFGHTSFLEVIDVLDIFNVRTGVIAEAEDWIYELGNTEIKLTHCDDKIFCWEIEATKPDQTDKELLKTAAELGLIAQTSKELGEYWQWMKTYANKKYSRNRIERAYHDYVKRVAG